MFGYVVCYDIWKDLTNNHIYHKNDIFPYDNSEISEDRISELSSKNNKIGEVLIKARTLKDLSIEELKEYAGYLKIENIDSLNKYSLIKKIENSMKKQSNADNLKDNLTEENTEESANDVTSANEFSKTHGSKNE